jgi:predicted GNAT family acetyltransferase
MSSESSQVTKSEFRMERDGQVSWLAYEIDGKGWITLVHTEVPPELRGHGIANELAKTALDYAKEHRLKVEIICPMVIHFLRKHPEYKPLVGTRPRG